jgi:hypothetical protein
MKTCDYVSLHMKFHPSCVILAILLFESVGIPKVVFIEV